MPTKIGRYHSATGVTFHNAEFPYSFQTRLLRGTIAQESLTGIKVPYYKGEKHVV